MTKRAKRAIVVLSDLHGGSTVGLWPGEHAIEGGGVYRANQAQQWLHRCWQDCVAQVRAMRPKPIIVLNGDAIQGINAKDGQIIGATVSTQVDAMYTLLQPLRDACARLYIVRGTEWHDGKAADNLEMLAQRLDATPDPTTGQKSWWELYLNVGGPVIHFAHHIGTSSVPWYEATVPLRDTLMQLAELARFYGDQAPNVRLVVRSHRHRFIHVQAPPDLQTFVTPAWQLKTAFAHKKASAMLPQVGWVLVEWDGQDLVVKPRIYNLPALHIERLEEGSEDADRHSGRVRPEPTAGGDSPQPA